MKFGDIYTNGINHYVVVANYETACFHCGKPGKHEVKLMACCYEDGEVKYLHKWKEFSPSDIMPHLTLVKEIKD